jgi:hypothetical protein
VSACCIGRARWHACGKQMPLGYFNNTKSSIALLWHPSGLEFTNYQPAEMRSRPIACRSLPASSLTRGNGWQLTVLVPR